MYFVYTYLIFDFILIWFKSFDDEIKWELLTHPYIFALVTTDPSLNDNQIIKYTINKVSFFVVKVYYVIDNNQMYSNPWWIDDLI